MGVSKNEEQVINLFFFSFFNTLKLPGSGSDQENFNNFQHA